MTPDFTPDPSPESRSPKSLGSNGKSAKKPASQPKSDPDAEAKFRRQLAEFAATELGADLTPENERIDEPAPARTPAQDTRAPAVAVPMRERTCPKCRTKNDRSLAECKSCGIVFARFKPGADERVADELQLAGRRDLIALWESVMSDYTNESKHEAFIAACRRSNSLPFAAYTYSRILRASHGEEIAAKMRDRVVGLASFGAETSGDFTPWAFRVPKLSLLAILLSSIVFFCGLFLPSQGKLGVGPLWVLGLVMLCLTLMATFALRPPRP